MEILRLPVIDQRFVDFAQQVVLIGVDTVEFSIGGFTQPSLRVAKIGGQFLARHRLPFAVDGEGECKGVRDDVVERMDGAATRDVLDVDDLLFRFGQRVRLKPANGFKVISKRAGSSHEPAGILLIDALPPEIEKYQPILKCREPLFDLSLKRTSGEVFRVLGEPEVSIGADFGGGSRDVFTECQQWVKDGGFHGWAQLVTRSFKSCHLGVDLSQQSLKTFNRLFCQM